MPVVWWWPPLESWRAYRAVTAQLRTGRPRLVRAAYLRLRAAGAGDREARWILVRPLLHSVHKPAAPLSESDETLYSLLVDEAVRHFEGKR